MWAKSSGADGLALGGAAGVEIDRYDLRLGTPPGTLLLACSEGHSDNYPKVVEEIAFTTPGLGGTQDYQIRGDMVLSRTKNDGAVFATGSIAWGQALPWNDGNNDVAPHHAECAGDFHAGQPSARLSTCCGGRSAAPLLAQKTRSC